MGTITLISGFASSGKSTVSRLLAERCASSLHISVDTLREMTVSGQVKPDAGGWTDEGYRQFERARSTAIYMAKLYAAQVVDVFIDDVCVPYMFSEHYASLLSTPMAKRILLMPTRASLRERMRQRNGPWDHVLPSFIDEVYDYLEPMPKTGWVVLDTSDWSIEKTITEVAERIRTGDA